MKHSNLTLSHGKIARPQKAVIYGPEGVGKSTLASHLPSPVFLDTEGGTHHLDVVRFPDARTWDDVTSAAAQLARGDHEFKSFVIDTADWLEKRLAEHLCRKASKESIEDFGYGKGYVLVAEEFAKFLASLDTLLHGGMHIVFLAHSTVRKFESPDQVGSYDRYELKLSKQVAPLLKEWADLILFTNYVTKVAESDSGRRRGIGGRERVIMTTHCAAYDAKNRHGLEEKLPFSYDAIAPVFASNLAPASRPKSQGERLAEILGDRVNDGREFLIDRGQLTKDGSLNDVDADYAARIFAEPGKFLAAVESFNSGAAQ
jgi:GTPase SAR1 family protein